MATLRIHSSKMYSQPPTTLRIHGSVMYSVAAVLPDPGPDLLLESQKQTVSIKATIPGTPSAWAWTLLKRSDSVDPGHQGWGLALVNANTDTVSFVPPQTIDGTVLTLEVRATLFGVVSQPGTVVVSVKPHQVWIQRGTGITGWRPVVQYVLSSDGWRITP